MQYPSFQDEPDSRAPRYAIAGSELRNISRTGALIETARVPEVGTLVELSLGLPNGTLEGMAEVVRVEHGAMGVQFIMLTERSIDTLARFLVASRGRS